MRVSKSPQERKLELIAAARRLFDERGIHKTRVSDIVQHVGVAQGVFYYYFSSKEEIISIVIEQVDQEMEERANAILDDPSTAFCHKLSLFIDLYLDLIDQFLADGEENLSSLYAGPGGEEGPVARGSAILTEKLIRLIREGADGGHISAAYPEESALILLYGLRTMGNRQVPSRRMIYTLAEQTFRLPEGKLTQYCDTQKRENVLN